MIDLYHPKNLKKQGIKSEWIALLIGILFPLFALGIIYSLNMNRETKPDVTRNVAKSEIQSNDIHIVLTSESLYIQDKMIPIEKLASEISELNRNDTIDRARISVDETVRRDRLIDVLNSLDDSEIDDVSLEMHETKIENLSVMSMLALLDMSSENRDSLQSIIKSPPRSHNDGKNNQPETISPKVNIPQNPYGLENQKSDSDANKNFTSGLFDDLKSILSAASKKVVDNSPVDNASILSVNNENPKPKSAPDTSSDLKIIKDTYKQEILNKIDSLKVYPPIAQRLHHEGRILVEFTVLNNGNIDNLNVSKASSYDELDNAAIDAVRQASPFNPIPHVLNLNSMAVSVWITFQIQ